MPLQFYYIPRKLQHLQPYKYKALCNYICWSVIMELTSHEYSLSAKCTTIQQAEESVLQSFLRLHYTVSYNHVYTSSVSQVFYFNLHMLPLSNRINISSNMYHPWIGINRQWWDVNNREKVIIKWFLQWSKFIWKSKFLRLTWSRCCWLWWSGVQRLDMIDQFFFVTETNDTDNVLWLKNRVINTK